MAEKQDLSLFGMWYSHYIATSINQNYGRKVTSYRIATEMESNKWKTFRQTWIKRIDNLLIKSSFIPHCTILRQQSLQDLIDSSYSAYSF